jgi:hypothetical protein
LQKNYLKYFSQQQYILFSTLVLISIYYFISSCYINTSNDGSHYALVSALVNNHSVCINDYIHYTGKVDYAVKDGIFYSDRLPGNAFLMIPFFAFGNLLEVLHLNTLSQHIPIQEVTVILLPNLCGVLGALFIYLLCKEFKASFRISLLASIIYAVCTLNLQESTHVFSHATSMCLVLAAFYYLIKTPSIYHKQFLWFVFLLSYSIIVELQNSLLFLPALLYIYQTKKIDFKLKLETIKVVGLSLSIIVATISILIMYNYIAFGEITLKSNKFNPEFPEEQSFITSLSGDFVSGIDRLFTNFLNPEVWAHFELGVKNDIPGLLITSPILLFSLFGFIIYFKKYPKEAFLFIFIILINVLIGAFHKTVLTRHIFTITPFLFFPIVFTINFILENKYKPVFIILFSVLAIFSAFRVFYVTHTYWGREITNVFPFAKEFNIYLVFFVFIGILLFPLYFKKIKLNKQELNQ